MSFMSWQKFICWIAHELSRLQQKINCYKLVPEQEGMLCKDVLLIFGFNDLSLITAILQDCGRRFV